MNTEKTTGTIKTQRWNIHKINGRQKYGQIILELAGDANIGKVQDIKLIDPEPHPYPTANKAKQADFIKVLPI